MKSIPATVAILLVALTFTGSAAQANSDDKNSAGKERMQQNDSVTRTAPATEGSVAIEGKRERRLVRMARWHDMLQGDRLRIHQKMGHPTYRYYELQMGVRTELWTYPEADRIYVFEGDRLIDTRLD